MALPTPPPFNQPIPNNPFYFPLNSTLQGDYSPFIVGSGLFINYSTGVIQATGGGGAGVSSITPGIGIAVTGGGVGDVLLSNTGVIDILAGYGITVASDGFGNYTVSTTGTLGTVTSVTAGPGLSGGTITTAGTISLPNLYATPLTTYPYPVSVSVDNFGRVAAISEGTPPLTYSLFTGKGQLIAGRGSNSAGIVPAAPDGCVLVACTACLEGMTWADPTPGPSVTITGIAPITVAGTPTNPVIAISPATTSACGAVQLNNTVTCNSVTQALTAAQGCNLQQQINNIALCNGTVTSVTGSYPVAITGNPSVTPNITVCGASTLAPGVVQLNDTTSSTSLTQALTANMGKNLQDQINSLVVSGGLIFAGTINGSTGFIATTSSSGAAAGFVVGSPLLVPTASLKDYFFIVTTAGTMTPPGGVATSVIRGDWWLCDGTAWIHVEVGNLFPYASTSEAGTICLATAAEVQTGLDALKAITPSTLQSNVSNSVLINSSTCIASSTAVKCAYDTALNALALVSTDATTTVRGVTCYATNAETQAGTIGNKAVVPSALQSKISDACNLTSSVTIASSTAVSEVCAIAASKIPCSVFTAKGQVLAGTGPGTFLPICCNIDGLVLAIDSTAPTGLSWCAAPIPNPAEPQILGGVYACTLNIPQGKTALGYFALDAVTTGVGNVAVGSFTGKSINTGSDNTLVGTEAGCNLTDSYRNTAIGMQAGCGLGVASNNVLVGAYSGCALTAGDHNVFVGPYAGCETSSGNCALRIGRGDVANGYWLCANGYTDLYVNTNLGITSGSIRDCTGSLGTAGQILSSNGTHLQWASPSCTIYQVYCGDVTFTSNTTRCDILMTGMTPGCYFVSSWGSMASPQNSCGDFALQSVSSGGAIRTASPPLGYQFPNTAMRQPWTITWGLEILSITDCILICASKAGGSDMCWNRAASAKRLGVF